MTIARKKLIDVASTPYYHVINRCVRRAFLCGTDTFTGKDYSHRRQWIVDKIKKLSKVFAIDVCAYAVMSNHYHLVLHIDAERAKSWSIDEVIDRWYEIFRGNLLVDRYRSGEPLSKPERDAITACAQIWRNRLYDISWFMRCLNERIAREANAEDQCTGSFWEGRFKSQALLDETALLTCMMYVDLNPIRAGIANSLDASDYTSIQERIFTAGKSLKAAQHTRVANPAVNTDQKGDNPSQSTDLFPFLGAEREDAPLGIAYSLIDYLTLTDWTGRAIREDKKGAIPADIRPILSTLTIQEEHWLHSVKDFGQCFGRSIGPERAIRGYNKKLEIGWSKGMRANRRLYQVA